MTVFLIGSKEEIDVCPIKNVARSHCSKSKYMSGYWHVYYLISPVAINTFTIYCLVTARHFKDWVMCYMYFGIMATFFYSGLAVLQMVILTELELGSTDVLPTGFIFASAFLASAKYLHSKFGFGYDWLEKLGNGPDNNMAPDDKP